VTFDAVDHAVVAGDLGLPVAVACVVAKLDDVGQLRLERRLELGGGNVVVALLADVGVGACLGDEVSRAVAVGDAGPSWARASNDAVVMVIRSTSSCLALEG
jgi:hypothetical protein